MKLVGLSLAAALTGVALASAARAQAGQNPGEQPPAWIADAATGCKVWDPDPVANEMVAWSGACAGGLAQGPGVTRWTENGKLVELTEGSRVAGHLQGAARQQFANGDRYEGQFRDDRKNGQGTYTAGGGGSYVGSFKDDLFDGQGTLTQPDGSSYDGEWRQNRRDGQGTETRADGTRLTGQWKDDALVGTDE